MEGATFVPRSPPATAASVLPLANKLPHPESTSSSPSAVTSRSSSAGSTVTQESHDGGCVGMLSTADSLLEDVGAGSGGDGSGNDSNSNCAIDSSNSGGASCDDAGDSDENVDENVASPLTQLSTLRLSASDKAMGITVDSKTNMKLDKYDYRKSKDGKEGNALRAHNPLMRIMPSPVPGSS